MLAAEQQLHDRPPAVSVMAQSTPPHSAYSTARSTTGESIPVLMTRTEVRGESTPVETETSTHALTEQQIRANEFVSAWEGYDAAQVAVYMNSMERLFWRLTLQVGEKNAEKIISTGHHIGLKNDVCSISDCLGCFRQFKNSSLKKFALAVRHAAVKPPHTTWSAYLHPSVATALSSMGIPDPSLNQIIVMKHFTEQVAVGQGKEGLIVKDSTPSRETVALLAVAVSTAIEASEGIAKVEKQMGISKDNENIDPSNSSIRADAETVSPLIIVLAPTTVLADLTCRSIKQIATHGRILVSADVFREGQGERRSWDYVSHREGRSSYLLHQVDIAVCTPGALKKLIWNHTISTRNTRLVMLQNGETLFEVNLWGGNKYGMKEVMKQLAPKNYQTVVGQLWPWVEEVVPKDFMSYSNAVRVVLSASHLISPEVTDHMIEALNPFHRGFVKEVKLSKTIGTKPLSGESEDQKDIAGGKVVLEEKGSKDAGGHAEERADEIAGKISEDTKDTACGGETHMGEKRDGEEEGDDAGESVDETGSQLSEDSDDEGGVDIRAWL
ncbi:hypothetical protein M409DRAFT_25012 [Zasmidium cellare ATCC 36951]|uniref:Uncharacterized protein n=1 Tax=Zasmidium cellare ATCC 36951 TaxID=1080233 RepID=A0A6A6CC35_ZASCE|nr:uncharacterized protein M409DRAFT_25012 [Zasmidium cellare ATCC 36951]KAF2164615.1 hypothetical protein M409DRAFT_25012 [Zasmidium cellare ATCC 36951]